MKNDKNNTPFIKNKKVNKDSFTPQLDNIVQRLIALERGGVISPVTMISSDFSIYEPPKASDQWTMQQFGYLNMSTSEFLSTFYDPYVGTHSDGLTITKSSLGKDQSGQYDIYEYDFKPANYKRTILLSGGMHANELDAAFGLAHFFKHLMTQPYVHQGFQYIRENVRVKIIAIANPWGFNQNPKAYGNVRGVNQNRNWDSELVPWSGIVSGAKGSAPFSEAETRIYRDWNLNNPTAEFWIDCHTDPLTYDVDVFYYPKENGNYLFDIMRACLNKLLNRVKTKYAKATPSYWEDLDISIDPKGAYLFEQLNRPTVILEFNPANTLWGGTSLNNEGVDITEFEAQLSTWVFYLLSDANTLTYTNSKAPVNVTNLKTSKITSTSLTLKWNASGLDNSYDVYNGSTLLGTTKSAKFNVTGLTLGTQYTFKVVAKNNYGSSSGTTVTVTTSNSSQTIYVSDSFARTNANSLESADTGQIWNNLKPTKTVFATNGTQATIATTSGANDYAIIDAGVSNGTLDVDLPAKKAGTMIYIRNTDIDNGFALELTSTDYKFWLWKANQADVLLGSGTDLNATTIDHVKVVLNGSNIKIYLNNNATPSIDKTDTNFQTVTKYGFGGFKTAGIVVDNFTVKA